MDELQKQIWDVLVNQDGDTVARAFTGYHGMQLLTEEFAEYLVEEGIADISELSELDDDDDEEDDDEEEEEEEELKKCVYEK